MFNFNNTFDFNSVLENKRSNTYALSLDDFEDDFNDIPEEQPSKQRIDDDIIDVETDFRMFLKANVFKPINVNIDPMSGNLPMGNNRCAWKSYIKNGEKHYLAYINIIQERNSKRYEHDIYVDLNDKTKELHIGNCTTYNATKFLNISYPLIKICEHYKDGPVYIGCIHIDKPYAVKGTANNILNSIETPLSYLSVSSDVSFWRTVWNGKGYYLPDIRPGMKLAEIESDLKLSLDFINHFNGFDSSLHNSKCPVFYNMFNSFEDFYKITKLLCDAGSMVFAEFGIELRKSNYNENIILFENTINEKLGIEFERKRNLAEAEDAAQKVLVELLPQNVIDHFESINSKVPTLLSIRTMAKERKFKDPYRKLDLPIIKLILKDNGIDIDKIVNDYEQQWLANFYNFTNTFYKHLQKLNVASTPNQYNRYPEYELIVNNLFIYDRLTLKFEDANGEKRDFDGLTDEEVSIIKAMAFGLKPELKWEGQDLIIDKQRLDNPDDEACIALCRLLLSALGRYSAGVMSDSIEENNHVYNEFIMIQRFVYLLYKLYSEDFNKDADEDNDKLPAPDPTSLFNMRYSYVSFGYHGDYYPFNFGDIGMKLNTYNQLYKFIKYIAYIIENGYDIHYPNVGGAYGLERFLNLYDVNENLNELVEKEFSLSNVPNIKLLNMNSINKMFSTIFTNIDKKI